MRIAVELLLHLIETMHRARGIGVIGIFRVRELVRAGRQGGRALAVVADTLIGRSAGLSRAAGQQILIIGASRGRFRTARQRDVRRRDAGRTGRDPEKRTCVGRRRSADERGRQGRVGLLGVRRHFVGLRFARLGLPRLKIVRAGRSVGLHDAAREQVQHRLVLVDGLVGGEHVVEAAVFADDYDHVLDWRSRIAVVAPRKRRRYRIDGQDADGGAGKKPSPQYCASELYF